MNALRWNLHQVSGNHRLDDSKSEQERIKAEGFEVSSSNLEGRPCGPLRVWPGGLAMGRSLGDYEVCLAVTCKSVSFEVHGLKQDKRGFVTYFQAYVCTASKLCLTSGS